MCTQRPLLHSGELTSAELFRKELWELGGGSVVKACDYCAASSGHRGNSISKRGVCACVHVHTWTRKSAVIILNIHMHWSETGAIVHIYQTWQEYLLSLGGWVSSGCTPANASPCKKRIHMSHVSVVCSTKWLPCGLSSPTYIPTIRHWQHKPTYVFSVANLISGDIQQVDQSQWNLINFNIAKITNHSQ